MKVLDHPLDPKFCAIYAKPLFGEKEAAVTEKNVRNNGKLNIVIQETPIQVAVVKCS